MTISCDREFTVLCPDCYKKIATSYGGRGRIRCEGCGLTITYNVRYVPRRKQKSPAKILLKREAKLWLAKEE